MLEDTLIAGNVGMGKTTLEKRMLGKALLQSITQPSKCIVITLDITGEFVNWTKERGGDVYNAFNLKSPLSDILYDKQVIDFSFSNSSAVGAKSKSFFPKALFALSSVVSFTEYCPMPVIVNLPECFWYFSTKNSLLSEFLRLFKTLLYRSHTADVSVLMESASIKDILSKRRIESFSDNSLDIMDILRQFDVYTLFNLSFNNIKLFKFILGSNWNTHGKAVDGLSRGQHININNTKPVIDRNFKLL